MRAALLCLALAGCDSSVVSNGDWQLALQEHSADLFGTPRVGPAGAPVDGGWSLRGNSPSYEDGYAVALSPGGTALIVGTYSGLLSAPAGTQASVGQYEPFIESFSSASTPQWAQAFQGVANSDFGIARGVAADDSGNSFVTGYFSGSLSVSGRKLGAEGPLNGFAVSFDPTGSIRWAEELSGDQLCIPESVATTSRGDLLIAGHFSGDCVLRNVGSDPDAHGDDDDCQPEGGGDGRWGGRDDHRPHCEGAVLRDGDDDLFVIKLSSLGRLEWARQYRHGRSQGRRQTRTVHVGGIAINTADEIAIAGGFEGTLYFGQDHDDRLLGGSALSVFAAKLDSDGEEIWAERFGGSSDDEATSVAFDPAGNVLVAGSLQASMQVGLFSLTSAGGTDAFVVELDANGSPLWANRFGDALDQSANGVSSDTAGHVNVAGAFEGTMQLGATTLVSAGLNDIFVAQLDANGSPLWARRFGDPSVQAAYALASDASGEIAVTGTIAGTVDFGFGPVGTNGGYAAFVLMLGSGGSAVGAGVLADAQVQDEVAYSVATDASANVLVTGAFSGSADFGSGSVQSAGGLDLFVAKYDPQGAPLWSVRFGDSQDQQGHALGTDAAGNVYVAGVFQGSMTVGASILTSQGQDDVFLLKLSPSGQPLWARSFGDASEQVGWALAIDAQGNSVVAGSFEGAMSFGSTTLQSKGFFDVFLAKVDPNGSPLWAKSFGDPDVQQSFGVALDGSGNILLTGAFAGTIDFGAGPLTSAGLDDAFVAKLSPAGAALWSHALGDADEQYGVSIAADAAGSVILAGSFAGSIPLPGQTLTSAGGFDVLLAKWDSSGSFTWAESFGGPLDECGLGVVSDAQGNILETGSLIGSATFGPFQLTSAGAQDIYLVQTDAAGNPLFAQRFGDAMDQRAYSVTVDPMNRVVLAGDASGSIDFGQGALLGSGGQSIVVADLPIP